VGSRLDEIRRAREGLGCSRLGGFGLGGGASGREGEALDREGEA
jgi:hypothetical protein